jgi:gamma-carbonic anhydrase
VNGFSHWALDVERWALKVSPNMHITPDTLPTGHAGIATRLKKGPTIHSSAWVVPGATVIGDVILEEESSVWYGAVLRGDINRIVIGPRSNIQDNAVVHVDTNYPTTMGELVTVGHTAIVHACKIDNEVLIGMGAIILDDVEVGARSIVGANALVTIGTKIPPGSLVLGSPAKIHRQLSLDEQKDIARWAWSYVETAKQYREFC